MHSSIAIRIAAPPAVVFALARDVDRWPERLPHYRRVLVRGRRGDRVLAQMVAVRQLGPIAIPVTWRAVCWPEGEDLDDLRLRFRHVRGVTRGMDVTWHIRPDHHEGHDGSHVTIEHVFQRPLPLVGPDLLPRIVDRWFTTAIAGRTLQVFRALAETVPLPGAKETP